MTDPTEQDIARYAAEAEAGYDPDQLVARGDPEPVATQPDEPIGTPILDDLLARWQAPETDPPEPDEFDVHPDLIGEPVVVDYDTGEVLTYAQVADRAAGTAVVEEAGAQDAEHTHVPERGPRLVTLDGTVINYNCATCGAAMTDAEVEQWRHLS